MKNNKQRKGFTLIELLVVIAIIAVLSVVVILTLNPAELLRQARDSNRISDIATMKSALSLFEADVTTSSTSSIGTYGILYTASTKASTSTTAYIGAAAWGFATTSVGSVTSTANRAIDGTGWIPAKLSLISSGSPIGSLPVDPSNDNVDYYTYVASSSVFKFGAKMESSKYNQNGGSDVVSQDGGSSPTTFEAGTNLSL